MSYTKGKTQIEIEKSNAFDAFINDVLPRFLSDSIFLKEPHRTTFIGNMRTAFYEGSRFKPSVLSEGEAIDHLSKIQPK